MSVVQTTPERPNLASFRDHRAYLQAMIGYLKATRRGFSYRSFSKAAGFASPNFLLQVANGQRNLSTTSIAKFAHALGLDEREHTLFEALVLFGQATNDADRDRYYRRLVQHGDGDPVMALEAEHYEVYTRWYAWVIHELAGLPDFDEDPVALSRRILPRVPPHHAKRALELLQRLELLVRNPEGKLERAQPRLTTGPSVRSLAIRNYHRTLLGLASEALDTLPQEARNITSVTVALGPERYAQACDLITELRHKILLLAEAEPPNQGPRAVHQLMFALFPVSKEPPR